MKQLDKVQEMKKICAFQEYHRYEQEQNQKDTIYHIHFRQKGSYVSTYVKNVVVKLHVSGQGLQRAFRIQKCLEIISDTFAFLDVFISGISNQNLTLQTYRKSTYAGLLLNCKSFTSFSYKISLIKCLVDRSFKICNNWNTFHNGIKALNLILLKTHIRHS